MIFEVVVVFSPEFPIRVHNKLHQPPPRIAYMDLGIVPLAAPSFFLRSCSAHFPVFFVLLACREPKCGEQFTALAFEDRRVYTRPSCLWATLANPNRASAISITLSGVKVTTASGVPSSPKYLTHKYTSDGLGLRFTVTSATLTVRVARHA